MSESTTTMAFSSWTNAATASGADIDVTMTSKKKFAWALTTTSSAPSIARDEAHIAEKTEYRKAFQVSLRHKDGTWLWAVPIYQEDDSVDLPLTVTKPTGA